MEYKVSTSIPISFEKLEDEADSRFLRVKIWLCHTGKNHNRSYFSKEVLTDMIPSLANTPILGYISVDNLNETDFNGHEQRIVIEQDNMRIEYIGRAYGLIPENNNAQFEMKTCSDGIEREFLTCEGLLWQKFAEAVEIIERDKVKGQSMELEPESIKGKLKRDGLFHYEAARFEGACILGDSVKPAMHDALIEKFSTSEIKMQLQEMLQDLHQYQSQGGDNVFSEDDIKTEDVVEEATESVEEVQTEEEQVEKTEVVESDGAVEEIVEDSVAPEEFALVNSQLTNELLIALREEEIEADWGNHPRYWYVDHDTERVIAVDGADNYRLVALAYSFQSDKVIVDFESRRKVKVQYVPIDDGDATEFAFIPCELADLRVDKSVEQTMGSFATELEQMKNIIEAANEELQELRQYKQAKVAEEFAEQVQSLFDRFATELAAEEMQPLMDAASEYSLEELENRLYVMVGKKKATFSTTTVKKDKADKIALPDTEAKRKYDKEWGHLIEETLGKRS